MGYDPDPGGGERGGGGTTKGPTRGKRVGFLGYCRDQKELYPHHVVLVRCGDFYETFGVDAILLVEHVGLNPMGGKARSGCPKQNIQPTLDGLTRRGFSVAVYEELAPIGSGTNANTKATTKKLKERSLAQIVSPAAPTYLYDNWLLGGDDGAASHAQSQSHSLDGLPPPRPCVGIVHTAAGYNVVEVSLEERSVRYSERLTCEAVACRLAAYPPADPLLYVPSPSEQHNVRSGSLPFLPRSGSGSGSSSGSGRGRLRTKILEPHLVPEPVAGESDADRYDFSVVTNGSTNGSTATNPLYVETATQLGLMDDTTIPSLIKHVLDDAAPAPARRFLERYLLIPPPPGVARAMAKAVGTLTNKDCSVSLPPLAVPNLGKSLILIRAGQAGANVYGELLQSLDTTKCFVEALLHMCEHESGLPAERESLLRRCRDAIDAIEAVVSSAFHVEEDYGYASVIIDENDDSLRDVVSRDEFVPPEFFERNEKTWRGRVQPSVVADAYRRVRSASQQLARAVREDFIGGNESNKALIKYNYFDNLISLQKKPIDGVTGDMEFVHPYDRFGKVLSNRWTTEKVKQAVSHYVSECENATNEVAFILSDLAQNLQDDGHIPAIVQSSHLNLILSTAFHHAVKATNSGWQLATAIEDQPTSEARFVDVFPYWMHRSKAVTNTFDLSSMILLTAPNMSGKSTLMRSTAAAALLTICGLCAPLSRESRISRFDTLFLRGASADVPTEDKSAFGAEMGDLAALFRCSGPRSFVFVDELGRGTSPRDGTRLAGAVLERMAESGMSGVFATHLHDVLDLPLRKDRIVTKRIRIDRGNDGDGSSYAWTHKLEDGRCTDSMALVTAERFGLPEEILRRAEELTQFIPQRTATDFDSCERTDEDPQSRKPDRDSRLVPSSSSASSVEIPPRHIPPASLANRSCLYVLQLVPPALSSSSPPPAIRYYVGETDSIAKRLSQHRKKGGAWSRCKAVVFPVGNKSQARYCESALIGEMARAGYALESIVDGRTLRHLRD
eukprot:jgi/Psemu1/186574/e_gw1.59.102.1